MATALVLLPGLLCDDTVWAPQREHFERERSVLTVDFRGQDSFDAMAARVLEQAPDRFALAGHSMGGRVALEVVRQAAHRVEGLALLSAGIHPLMPGEAEKRNALVDLANREGIRHLAEQWIPPVLHPARRDDKILVGPLIEMWCRSSPADHAGQIRAALNRRDVMDLLPQIACPSLVLSGADDPWAPAETQRTSAAAITGAKLVLIAECGHMVTVERPDAVNSAMRDWLAMVDAAR